MFYLNVVPRNCSEAKEKGIGSFLESSVQLSEDSVRLVQGIRRRSRAKTKGTISSLKSETRLKWHGKGIVECERRGNAII